MKQVRSWEVNKFVSPELGHDKDEDVMLIGSQVYMCDEAEDGINA